MAMPIKIEKQSSKFIKPFVQTPPTLSHYKLGFTDEFTPPNIGVSVVLFFSPNTNHNPNFFIRLEESLGKTITRLYPLAGRYVAETATIECNDHGVEFIHAKVNIKLQDFLVSEMNVKSIDEFIPYKIGAIHQQSDPLLAAQITTFECGGVAIGVSVYHKIADASTLSTIINEWAITNREDNEIEFKTPGFNSSLLFPTRGLGEMQLPLMNEDILSKYTRKKVSFSKNVISNMKAKENNSSRRWSKVQLVSATIWKIYMDVDFSIQKFRRESTHIQAINLREKMASLIPKTSCGNLWALCVTECKNLETLEDLTNLLSDSVKKSVNNFSKGNHTNDEGQAMVLNSFSSNICESSNVVTISSWCKFPFYEADFGFGKPIWVSPGTIPINNLVCLMDDAEGNGVEAYILLEVKNASYFKEALELDGVANPF